jgi:hypothetical protein
MTMLTREQLMKELLPGLNKVFGVEYEHYEVDGLKKDIEKSDEEFVSKEVYLRVIEDYEKKLERQLEEEARRIKTAIHKGRSEGIRRAADYVEVMAEELGQSNLLHAVVLAILNMEVEE